MSTSNAGSTRGRSKHPGRLRIELLLVVVAGLVFALWGCTKRQESQTIKLPPTPVIGAQQNWAIVNSPLLRLRKQPSTSSTALITLRGGYVVEIVRRSENTDTIGGNKNYWYYINYKGLRGWVFGYYLTMFDSRQMAEQAAKGFK